jgi:hypothetical protein
MGKLATGLVVVLLTGCSGMGQYSSSGSSGSSSMNTATGDNSVPFNQQSPVDPRTGQLTLYHGG